MHATPLPRTPCGPIYLATSNVLDPPFSSNLDPPLHRCGMEISVVTSKDTVSTRKGKTLHQRYEWMERRCMIEMNKFQYIGSAP